MDKTPTTAATEPVVVTDASGGATPGIPGPENTGAHEQDLIALFNSSVDSNEGTFVVFYRGLW